MPARRIAEARIRVIYDEPLFDRKALLASFLPSLVVVARRRFAVRTSGRFRGEHAAELVEHPVLRRIESLEMMLQSTGHDRLF